MNVTLLRSGEPVYHPRFGFGTVLGITQQELGDSTRGDPVTPAEDYYEIDLVQSGTLFVPVTRVDAVGLRRLTNGLEAIKACLASPPGKLPQDGRQRLAELRACEQAREPAALSRAVRDLIACRRNRALTAAEQKWLDQACQRLSTEAAMVDNITASKAREAIRNAVNGLSSR